jgi:hypothetical protein
MPLLSGPDTCCSQGIAVTIKARSRVDDLRRMLEVSSPTKEKPRQLPAGVSQVVEVVRDQKLR